MGIISGLPSLLVVTCLCILSSPGVHGEKILVFPMDGSHWVNMNLLIQGLHSRGHEVAVVRTSTSWYIKESSPHYRSITVTLDQAMTMEKDEFFLSLLTRILVFKKDGATPMAHAMLYQDLVTQFSVIHQQSSMLAEKLLANKTLMQELADAKYDVALLDPGLPVGVLVAHGLKLPTVFNVRFCPNGNAHAVTAPSPWSYVPSAGYVVTDQMTFGQRVANVLDGIAVMCLYKFVFSPHWDRLVEKYLGPDLTLDLLLQGADIWLMREDFVFEFPRPTMPNIVYIGGFQTKPAEPLSAELEEFVQGSGDHGFILMSLGTLVKGLPVEITSEIAAAFAQIPQKVIWRHVGERPKNLGNNTLLVDWMPQNDLLGHPKARAFVSHCGTNGIYEAIYHGVPVIALPLMFDQFENVVRLEARGAAKMVDVAHISSQNFQESILEVLHNPSYRTNMKRLSDLHRDKPMHPLETALFWTEFVMRHKGASHLRTESYRMSWYSYYSVDVVSFLLAVLLLLTAAVGVTVRFLCCGLCRRRKPKKD